MASSHYFDYLGSVWALLPEEDKARLGELWHGFEQVFASVYQRFAESHLNIALQDTEAYSTERWLPYTFDGSNFVAQPAVLTSSQDTSLGLNLANKYLLRLSVDGGTPIEVDCRGLVPVQTTLAEVLAKVNAAFGFKFMRAIFDGTVPQLVSPTAGVSSRITVHPTSIPAANAAEFILGIDVFPTTFPEYPWVYAPPYQNLASLPELQDAIRDENVTRLLTETTHYRVQNKTHVAFKEEPPEKLWARRSLFDEENPWNNYGFLMDIYQPNSPRYVGVLQGLWFAFWTGPKPSNVKKSLYLLFGLPTAQESGVVQEVTTTSITTLSATGVTRTHEIPTGLTAIVEAGQRIEKFDPLVSGIEVFDKINRPGFIKSEIGRTGVEPFLTEEASRGTGDTDETRALELLEEYTFLPQISVESFITPDINLANVKTFLDAIKPLNKTYLFQVIVGTFTDVIALGDSLGQDIDFDITSNLDSNETTDLEPATLAAHETSADPGLVLDTHGVLLCEKVEVEVRSFGTLIDTFTA